jgi:hypothetical protein
MASKCKHPTARRIIITSAFFGQMCQENFSISMVNYASGSVSLLINRMPSPQYQTSNVFKEALQQNRSADGVLFVVVIVVDDDDGKLHFKAHFLRNKIIQRLALHFLSGFMSDLTDIPVPA